MSPELERLLAALYERDTCEPRQRERWNLTFNRLVQDAIEKQPGLSREEFLQALRPRYIEFRKQKRKPPTLPPSA